MAVATKPAAGQQLSLPEELILMLLNEESGYFYQVPGWSMNCALVGAAIAELSFRGNIDSDVDSLILLDATPTGNPNLDPILREIAAESQQRNVRYWIERLAPQAESILHQTLDRLTEFGILEHHAGEFWTISQFALHSTVDRDGERVEFVKTRLRRVIFADEFPDPRDVVIIALANACDVLRFMFELNDPFPQRIESICRMDLFGRAIGEAVDETIAAPALSRTPITKAIPTVPLRKLLFNPHRRSGNLPAMLASIAEEYGPVFRINPPFMEPMIFLAGESTNHWAHRYGRLHLTAGIYIRDFESAYGARGILPGLDGADHYRYRKTMAPAYSRHRLEGQLDALFGYARAHMETWTVGDSLQANSMCRRLINAEISPIAISVDTQDIIDDVLDYKKRALMTHAMKVLPKFMLNTPRMKRNAKAVDELIRRVQSTHTPAQRAGCPPDIVDDLLSMHSNDQQFMPESNLRFALSSPLVASFYLGDVLSFALHTMVTQPAMCDRIRAEADALFDQGDPAAADFTDEALDVTNRFIKEVMRIYPIVAVSVRTVANTVAVEGYELPVGARVFVAQAASHYMPDIFPDPERFDIDRYLPDRREDVGMGYAPGGLGPHACLGYHWMELQLAINLLLLAHHFEITASPAGERPIIEPFPSLSLGDKMKFVIAGRRREIPTAEPPNGSTPVAGCPVAH